MKSFQKASKEYGVCAETIVNYTKKGWLKKNEHYVEKGEGLNRPIRFITPEGEKELRELLEKRKYKRMYLDPVDNWKGRVNGGRYKFG